VELREQHDHTVRLQRSEAELDTLQRCVTNIADTSGRVSLTRRNSFSADCGWSGPNRGVNNMGSNNKSSCDGVDTDVQRGRAGEIHLPEARRRKRWIEVVWMIEVMWRIEGM